MPSRQSQLITFTLTFAILFWFHPSGLAPSFAATPCGSQASISGKLNVASKVEANRVLICADWLRITKSKQTGSMNRAPVPSKAPLAVKAKRHSAASGSRAKSHDSMIRYSHSTSASPAAPRIFASKVQAQLGERISFRAITAIHSRYRYLLGLPAEIRFTPVGYFWDVGDGAKSPARATAHAYQSEGSKIVRLRVKFAIAFRFAGSSFWRKLAKPIWVAANPSGIQVSTQPAQKRVPRFVFYDCRQQPRALGCFG